MRIRSRSRSRVAGLIPCALLACWGCGDAATDKLPRHAVSGSVTLDGKPLDSGMISFDPDSAAQADPVSGGGLVQGGSYSIAQATGLTPGTYRVSIRSGGGGGGAAPATDQAPGAPPKKAAAKKDPIPEQYNAKSTLKAEVKDGSSARFDFDLKSR